MIAALANRKQFCRARSGFSLLEVVLALGILAGAIIVLGELARLGIHNARAARDLARGQMLCESKMAEYTSGLYVPDPVSQAAFDATLDPRQEWYYTVEMNATADEELLSLAVTVGQQSTASPHPVEFTLVRWIRDPGLQQTTNSAGTSDTSTTEPTGGENG